MAKKTKGANKRKKKAKYIKNKEIVKFLLQHLEKENIDFSKVKISSFSDDMYHENEEFKFFQKKDQMQPSGVPNAPQKTKLPLFGFNLLNELTNDNRTNETVKFSSSIFQ